MCVTNIYQVPIMCQTPSGQHRSDDMEDTAMSAGHFLPDDGQGV